MIGAPSALPKASSTGSTSQAYNVLYAFKKGYDPRAGLIEVDGTLYGTTYYGGSFHDGTVFSVSTTGAMQLLHTFTGGCDGSHPTSALVDVNGTLYGTTIQGGCDDNFGTVYSITTSGSEKVLYAFKSGSDGDTPWAGLTYANGLLYGTTLNGGSCSTHYQIGCGTVFTIGTDGTENVIYHFKGGVGDGANPASGLTELHGMLYGTTTDGGEGCAQSDFPSGCGTVYRIGKNGDEKVVLNTGKIGSVNPAAALVNLDGTLYGTASGDQSGSSSTAYSVTPQGKAHVLYTFGPDDIVAGLTAVNGALYGASQYGGTTNRGFVFSLTTSGKERVLHNFTGRSDGGYPVATLLDLGGTLYGTTSHSGKFYSRGKATVFTFTP
jgi:uncharacterized repeat protein (TIGR03803 family)